jgi:hypothetical protein
VLEQLKQWHEAFYSRETTVVATTKA